MTQSRNALIYSSGLIIGAIVGIGLSLSTPKPLRILPLAATIGLSSAAAYFAQKGLRPAEIEAMDRAAELACLEAERENALEEIQESDDIERELSTYERRLNIEAEAMRRTFPAKIEMQRMQQLLYPPQIVINQSAAKAAEVMTAPSVVATPDGLFDWNSLKDADRHPMLGMIAKMGGGKSLLVKWLAKYIMGGTVSVIDIYGSKKEWESCHVMWDYEEMVLWMAEDNKKIERDIELYRGKSGTFRLSWWCWRKGRLQLTASRNWRFRARQRNILRGSNLQPNQAQSCRSGSLTTSQSPEKFAAECAWFRPT